MTTPDNGREGAPRCFFAHLGDCQPETMAMAHLIPKSRLKTELRYKDHDPSGIWDRRCWRWMCGGPSKIGGHHGQFDAKQIRLDGPPPDLVEFLREYDLEWMAERYLAGVG